MIPRLSLLVAGLAMLICCAAQAQQITRTCFFKDQPFPQYMPLWQEGWSLKGPDGEKLIYAKPDMPLGGYAFIYYRNTGAKPLSVSDLEIDGVRMSQALTPRDKPEKAEVAYRSSILLSKLPKARIDKLMAAGWPAWWKPEPATIEPGACGEIVIRMRRPARTQSLKVGIIFQSGRLDTNVAVAKPCPRFATIAFAPDLKTVYLYTKHPQPGVKPSRVFVDEKEVTALAAMQSDPSLPYASIVLTLAQPLELLSYHCYRVDYADGSTATAGIRSWGREMVYGMWSSPAGGGDSKTATETFVEDYLKHNINCVMPYVVGACADYFNSSAGWDYCESRGMGRMATWPGPRDATFLFAMDEPDANDASNESGVPPADRLGMLGQYLVNWTAALHKSGPNSPVLLNVDGTYKPENWYMYHQLTDIPCVDPYYTQANFADGGEPYDFSAHTRPTLVQGVSAISQSAGQPKPLHVILCSTRYAADGGRVGRFPTPEEKRMEIYYAIGSGAKGISYWWFAYDSQCRGLAEGTPDAQALWKEIGLLGAEVRTAGPIITTSCPVDLPTTSSRFLSVRTLLSGSDTLAAVVVNDNVACDRLGSVVRPCENARVSVSLPSWIKPAAVVEVSADGITDVASNRRGGKLEMNLGTVDVSKFVIISSDPQVKTLLQKRYNEKFAKNVAAIRAG